MSSSHDDSDPSVVEVEVEPQASFDIKENSLQEETEEEQLGKLDSHTLEDHE
jgi:hypothetical protein